MAADRQLQAPKIASQLKVRLQLDQAHAKIASISVVPDHF